MKKFFTIATFSILSILAKTQIITQATSPSAIGTVIPGYSQVSTYNTVTYNYTPSTPETEGTPVDEDTTTEVIKVLHYADPISVNITNSQGNTTNTSIGKVWTLRIKVLNALNVGLTFSTFNLSANAEMYLFNEERTILKGEIKKSYFSVTTGLTIVPVKGNTVIIYIVEPNNFGSLQSTIAINRLAAGYQQIEDVGHIVSTF